MTQSDATRRQFLRQSLLASGLVAIGNGASLAQGLPAVPANPRDEGGLQKIVAAGNFGDLQAPDANGIRLPLGFSSRVIARSGKAVGNTGYIWHGTPDGGCVFPASNGGWIYVSNSEIDSGKGGASAIAFDSAGNILRAYRICSGTSRNCVGGPTPWGTWLSAEEVDRGRVVECDPLGVKAPIVRNALGWFDHEAVAFDTRTGYLYETEDKSDGRLYRFRPSRTNDLSAGTLEVARRVGSGPWKLEWLKVPTPNPSSSGTRTRKQVSSSSSFNGGEGIWFHNGIIYFTTKGDNRVWSLDTATDTLHILYDDNTSNNPILSGVDNVIVSKNGDVYVAEDGGDMQLVVLSQGKVAPIMKVEGQNSSEVTGIAFTPDGSRLYFSSQRGTSGSGSGGITYEIKGPFLSV